MEDAESKPTMMLEYSTISQPDRKLIASRLAMLAYACGIACLVLMGLSMIFEARFEASIPPGKDEDDVGGVPNSILSCMLMSPMLWIASGAFGITAYFAHKSLWTAGAIVIPLLVLIAFAISIATT